MKLQKKRTELTPKIVSAYYKDCSELILWNFVKCITTKNLNYLIISGQPSQENLSKAWIDIGDEYADLSQDNLHDFLLNLMSQISYLDEKLRIVYNIVAYLENKRSEGLIEVLQNDLEFPYEYSEESIQQDLKMTVNDIKMDQINLELSHVELKAFRDKNTEPTEIDYNKLISRVSKYQGYAIKQKETTLLEFTVMLNDFVSSTKPTQLQLEED